MKLFSCFEDTIFVGAGDIILAIKSSTPNDNIIEYNCDGGKGLTGLTISVCGTYLFAVYSNKFVCSWNIKDCILIGSNTIRKKPTGLVYSILPTTLSTTNQGVLLVSDKAGDIWALNGPDLSNQLCVSGHTASVITDMCIENKHSLVATSDRDEKIRITSFPNMITIESYCLGHTNVVTSCSFISNTNKDDNLIGLISTGWDHKIILWNAKDGSILDQIGKEEVEEEKVSNIDEKIMSIDDNNEAITEIEEKDNEDIIELDKVYDESKAGHYPFKVTSSLDGKLAAIIFFGLPLVRLFQINNNSSTLSFGNEIDINLNGIPVDIIFNGNHLAVYLPKPDYIQIFTLSYNNNNIEFKDDNDCMKIKEKCLLLNIDISQQLVMADDDSANSNSNGMRKHELDKPFDRSLDLPLQGKKSIQREGRKRERELREASQKLKKEKEEEL